MCSCRASPQVLAILGLGFAVWWVNYASDNIKATIEETLSPVVGTLLSAWNWLLYSLVQLKDRITGKRTCSWCCKAPLNGQCAWQSQTSPLLADTCAAHRRQTLLIAKG